MFNILVEKNQLTYIDDKDFCEHQNPLRFCNECQSANVNKLDIHKDIKSYIDNFLSNITKFPFMIYEEEDDVMEDCYRTYMGFGETPEEIGKGMFYFCDCSEEFIFGFLSYLSFAYSGCNENYIKKYNNKFQYELNKYTLADENLIIMAAYDNNGYFHCYATPEPEEFRKGWYNSQKIRLSVCKYNEREDETLHQDLSFQEIKENCL